MVNMKNYTHLSESERELLFKYLCQGESLRSIGKVLGRSHTTVLREVARNSVSAEEAEVLGYSPALAFRAAVERRRETRSKKLDDLALRHYVLDRLTHGWSPEQIAGRLRRVNEERVVSYETIYKFIYEKENRRLGYSDFLRRGHKRRSLLFGRKAQARKKLAIPNKTPITERPVEANLRQKCGHWETDLMEGKKIEGDALSVLADRKCGFLMLDKVPSKEADIKVKSLNNKLGRFTSSIVKTITFDNGTENFYHEKVATELSCQTYFCAPYHPFEKGTVENTIGLVRSYLPKGSSLKEVTSLDLNIITHELNTRPRKRLDFATPAEIMYKETGWCTST